MEEKSLEEFVRYLHDRLTDDGDDGRFAFFLGAGCSLSSEVDGAATLVRRWLPELCRRTTGEEKIGDDLAAWAKTHLGDYDPVDPAKHYAPVMRALFPHPPERQREIERIVRGKDPGFGYAVLAQLLAHKSHGPLCNVVLTTNFDDLVADALYLFTRTKPMVVTHDSLVDFVDAGRTRPNVIKIHGDAMLEPKNTSEETEFLGAQMKRALEEVLKNRTLIINGYGANDQGVFDLFESLGHDFLSAGAYWLTDKIPRTEFGEWFEACPHAVWVPHLDFNQWMLLVRDEFDLPHPDEKRFEALLNDYRESFSKLSGRVRALPDEARSKTRLVAAADKAASQFKDWWAVELAAREHRDSNPDEADRIYREGIEKFPDSKELLCNYANFLARHREDLDQAESYYKRALDADPDHANNLGNYAVFLANERGDFDQAEEYYRRALDADPDDAITLGNYGGFLLARGDASGFDLLRRCKDSDPDPDQLSEVLFYEYAHGDADQRTRALAGLKPLLASGTRSLYWSFAKNIDRARLDEHPNLPLLQTLAGVINDKQEPTALDEFPEWRDAASD